MAQKLSDSAALLFAAPDQDQAEEPGDQQEPAEELETSSTEAGADSPASSDQDQAEEPGDGGEGDAGEGEEPEPLTVAELAEALEMEQADVYEQLVVTIGEDRLTLGQLKDRGKDLMRSEQMLAEAKDKVEAADAEAGQIRRGVAVAMSALGRKPTQQELEQAEELNRDYLRAEAEKVVQVIPEWRDQPTAAQEFTQMGEMLESYGLRAHEIANISDHRQLQQIRDHMLLKRKLEQAQQQVDQDKPKRHQGRKRPKRGRRPTTIEAIKADVAAGKLTKQEAATAVLLGAPDHEHREP